MIDEQQPTTSESMLVYLSEFSQGPRRFTLAPLACGIAAVVLFLTGHFSAKDWGVACLVAFASDIPFQLILASSFFKRFPVAATMIMPMSRTLFFLVAFLILQKAVASSVGATNWATDNFIWESLLGCYFSLLTLESATAVGNLLQVDTKSGLSKHVEPPQSPTR